MKTYNKGTLLRIFIDETDQWHGEPLHHALIKKIKVHGLSGATTIRGFEGFGSHTKIHTASILRLSEDLPVVIEVAETDEKINEFLEVLDDMMQEGMVTVQHEVDIIKYTRE